MYNELCPPNSTQHVVMRGDTFWKLSLTYGVSVERIMAANPGANPDNLQIGSTLCIPTATNSPVTPNPSTHMKPTELKAVEAAHPTTCPEGTFLHTIQAGDTFWKLSLAHGVSVEGIMSANPGANPDNLQIGSTLCIPIATKGPVSPNPSTHMKSMKPTELKAVEARSSHDLPGRYISPYDSSGRYLLEAFAGAWCQRRTYYGCQSGCKTQITCKSARLFAFPLQRKAQLPRHRQNR